MIDLIIGGLAAWFAGDVAAMLAGAAGSVAAAKSAADQAGAVGKRNKAVADYTAAYAAATSPGVPLAADPARRD